MLITAITRRLVGYYILVIAVVVFLMAAFFVLFLNNFYRANLEENLTGQVQLAAPLFKEMLMRGAPPGELDSLCKDLGGRLGARITLVDPQGLVLGDTDEDPGEMDNHGDRPEVVEALQSGFGRATRYSHTLGQDMLYVAIPLDSEPFPASGAGAGRHVVRLALPLAGINRVVRDVLVVTGLFLLFSSLAALGVATILARRITGPIEAISVAAGEIARGEYYPPLIVRGGDELALLAGHIREMGQALGARMDQVLAHQKRLETVVFSMKTGVILVNDHLTIEMINPAAAKIFGLVLEEAREQPLFHCLRNHLLRENLQALLNDGKGRLVEWTCYYPRRAVLETELLPVPGSAGNTTAVLILINEVTALRSLEKMRSDFVANVSHELRTPLTSIRGYTDTILHEELSREQLADFLGVIERETVRLTSLVNDLLDLARIENEKEMIEKEPVSLEEILAEALCLVNELRSSRGVTISMEVASSGLVVPANRAWLRQALVNILENSIRHGYEGGQVTLYLGSAVEGARITVTDNGPGIPQADLPYIFERFYRVDKARSRRSGGTGLGLAIVKHILEAHGASFAIESPAAGGSGVYFWMILPGGNGQT